jgi:hypothetical protein
MSPPGDYLRTVKQTSATQKYRVEDTRVIGGAGQKVSVSVTFHERSEPLRRFGDQWREHPIFSWLEKRGVSLEWLEAIRQSFLRLLGWPVSDSEYEWQLVEVRKPRVVQFGPLKIENAPSPVKTYARREHEMEADVGKLSSCIEKWNQHVMQQDASAKILNAKAEKLRVLVQKLPNTDGAAQKLAALRTRMTTAEREITALATHCDELDKKLRDLNRLSSSTRLERLES